jgi:phosphate acetyltransferase
LYAGAVRGDKECHGMSFLEELEQRAKGLPSATIAYPEPEDERIVKAAALVAERGIAKPVLVGPSRAIPERLPPGVEVEVTDDSPRQAEYAAAYAAARGSAAGGRAERVAARVVEKPLAYAAMMVRCGHADGMVAGIAHPTASLLQAAGLAIGYQEGIGTPSSCFIMLLPEFRGEREAAVIFADCAVVVDPAAEQLADIAVAAARSARQFLGVTPRVAMLSFSTRGSAAHAAVDKVKEAAALAAERITDGYVDGELQVDSALNPRVAAKKGAADSEVAGKANVLVFPDLNSGNICYKAVQEFCGAQAVGPVLQGFARPVNDLSRGASVEDVVATTVVTVLQVPREG